ncbi:MAG: 4-alpha-glucanotransferase [Gammaproteobacteria bacterium]
MNLDARRAGVLLHPTSLPSGSLADVERWLDFLHAAGFGVWQMLPLGIPLAGLSPYQCASAFAVHPGLFPAAPFDATGFAAWRARQAHWLADFARFMILRERHGHAPWTAWPVPLRDRDPHALAAFDAAHASRLHDVELEQYRLAMAWQHVRAQAAARGIRLFGDMPIFVAHDSADVWAHRELFLLDETGQPTVVAGVPPDYFSETGQRWGNPHYDWAAMQADGFRWWRQRIAAHFEWFDLVRIDHFRGLAAAWTIPAAEPTAIHGHWVEAPGDALLQAIADDLGALPLVAEDLGIITPDVTALRHRFGLPGMAVLQFAFDHHADNPHKPENVQPDTVYYTGTHDNDTTAGWWAALPDAVRGQVMAQLGVATPDAVPGAMMATVLGSAAALAILPMQDLLQLGSAARMNTPGTADGNWTWRFAWREVPADLACHMLELLKNTNRCENPPRP